MLVVVSVVVIMVVMVVMKLVTKRRTTRVSIDIIITPKTKDITRKKSNYMNYY